MSSRISSRSFHRLVSNSRTHLVEEVLNELDLVRDLSSTEDSEEGLLRALENLGKVLELLLHEESGSLLRKVDADHARVSAVSGSERVVDVDVAELGQARAELLDLLRVGLGLLSLGVLAAALLLGVEAEVLEKDDLSTGSLGDVRLRLGSHAVLEEGDGGGEEGGELSRDGSERVLVDDVPVGAAQVRHEDHGGRAVRESVLDRRDRGGDALVNTGDELASCREEAEFG